MRPMMCRMDTTTTRTVVDRDPLACRTRWHAEGCEVVRYSDGSLEHHKRNSWANDPDRTTRQWTPSVAPGGQR
jgi:hypothetical protein